MIAYWNTYHEKLLAATMQHIELVGTTLMIAILIAVQSLYLQNQNINF